MRCSTKRFTGPRVGCRHEPRLARRSRRHAARGVDRVAHAVCLGGADGAVSQIPVLEVDAFKEFDKVFILTGGGPGTATELLSIYTYRINFKDWDLGYGAVSAFMVYLVVLILCAVFYKAVYWTEGRVQT